ncbi:41798_t:CDS:2, partial [Gigaspora margarita]
TSTNHWVISSDLNSEIEVEVLAYHIKFVTIAITNNDENNNIAEALNASKPETDISSNIAEANSYSAYCQFVLDRENTRHVNFHKQLVNSIFAYYSNVLGMILKPQSLKENMFNAAVSSTINVQLLVVP